MEEFAYQLRRILKRIGQSITPHFRQCLRLAALPYCYFFLVDWSRCTASRWRVLVDFLYIFFVLRYFPDNYSSCHFYEMSRSEWAYYYGSGYNPYQRGKLSRNLQPPHFHVLFEDKQVCQDLCSGMGIRVPTCHGVLYPGSSVRQQVEMIMSQTSVSRLIAKPVTGASGVGIFLLERESGMIRAFGGTGPFSLDSYQLRERFVLQEVETQHPDLERVYRHATNTVRILTGLLPDRTGRILSALVRFGVDGSFVDNWSAGGVAAGLDLKSGRVVGPAYDKRGRTYQEHPNSGIVMGDVILPRWEETLKFAKLVQESFPYYGMLGIDVCIGPQDIVLLEANACPDLIMQEQTSGPLLRDPANYALFKSNDLLFNRKQRGIGRA